MGHTEELIRVHLREMEIVATRVGSMEKLRWQSTTHYKKGKKFMGQKKGDGGKT